MVVSVVAGLTAAGIGFASAVPRTGRSALNPPPAPSYAEARVVPPYNVPMPDPSVLVGSHVDYLYTGAGGYYPPNFPVRSFTNLGHLGHEVDAMPTLPAWTTGFTWAPDVRRIGQHYVMWFAAPDVQDILPTGQPAKCLGLAQASSPRGPFVARPQPVVCGPWGAIDPRTFRAPNGQLWLDWKPDTNASWGASQNYNDPQNLPTTLWAQRLAPDGVTLEGRAHELLAATAPWEGKIIEAPDMVYRRGRYYLFFSANASYQGANAIGVASCQGPAGPCHERFDGPLVGSSTFGLGPGEESLFTQDGMTWLLFSPTGIGFFRQMAVARIAFGARGPYVATYDGAVPGFQGGSTPPASAAAFHGGRRARAG